MLELESKVAEDRALPASISPELAGPGAEPNDFMLQQICAISYKMRQIAIREVLSAHDLDMRDWQVLCALSELGARSQRDIAQTTKLDKVAVNRAARRLKDQNLVTPQRNDLDGRSHLLDLTELGREVAESSAAALQTLERVTLANFSQRESKELSRLLDRLSASIDRLSRDAV